MTIPTSPSPPVPARSRYATVLAAMTWLAGLLAGTSVVLLVAGVLRAWHPLPFWDMWDGYLEFWYGLGNGVASPLWWAQHNEHRILLARLLFWADLRVFRGAGWFLIACNVAASLAIATVLMLLVRQRFEEAGPPDLARSGQWLTSFTVVTVATAWMQHENLLWGFQVSFFLATLLPLLGLWALARSARARDRGRGAAPFWSLAGIVLAAASPWTLAAGLLAPFVAALVVWSIGLGRRVAIASALTGAAELAVYLVDYRSPVGHANPLDALGNHPLAVLGYAATYLGGPLYFATDSRRLAIAAGILLGGVWAAATVRAVRQRAATPTTAAVLGFTGFVIGQAVMTAAGRWNFGTVQALSGRYQTPILVAWACLLILVVPQIRARIARRSLFTPAALLGIGLLLLPQQLTALRLDPTGLQAVRTDPDRVRYERDTATLALALAVADAAALGKAYPDSAPAVRLAGRAMADGITSVGAGPYPSLLGRLGGADAAGRERVSCRGAIDGRAGIPGTPFTRISGWVTTLGRAAEGDPVLSVTDGDRRIVGFVTLGGLRPDVLKGLPEAGPRAGFTGYVLSEAVDRPLTAGGSSWVCSGELPRFGGGRS